MSKQIINEIVQQYVIDLYSNFEPQVITKKLVVTKLFFKNKVYLKVKSNNYIYDFDTKDEVGIWDPATKTIKPLPEDDEEDEKNEKDEKNEMTKCDFNYIIHNCKINEENKSEILKKIITDFNININSDDYKLLNFKLYYYDKHQQWDEDVADADLDKELFSQNYQDYLTNNIDNVVFNIQKYISIRCSNNEELRHFITEVLDSLNNPPTLK